MEKKGAWKKIFQALGIPEGDAGGVRRPRCGAGCVAALLAPMPAIGSREEGRVNGRAASG